MFVHAFVSHYYLVLLPYVNTDSTPEGGGGVAIRARPVLIQQISTKGHSQLINTISIYQSSVLFLGSKKIPVHLIIVFKVSVFLVGI